VKKPFKAKVALDVRDRRALLRRSRRAFRDV
jgi:hypothetical protein